MSKEKATTVAAITILLLAVAIFVGVLTLSNIAPVSEQGTEPAKITHSGDNSKEAGPRVADSPNSRDDGENPTSRDTNGGEVDRGEAVVDNQKMAAFAGVVADSDTGEPLEFVAVTAEINNTVSSRPYAAHTDHKGRYSFKAPPASSLKLRFIREDYHVHLTDNLFAEAGEIHTVNASLNSIFPCAITGIVIDADIDSPLGNVSININKLYTGTSFPTGYMSTTRPTAADGKFAARVSPGTYTISIRHQGYFYFESPELALAEGDSKDIRIPLKSTAGEPPRPIGITIDGHVTDANTGLPLSGAEVHWICREEYYEESEPVTTGADGFFILGVPVDLELELIACKPGYCVYSQAVYLGSGETFTAQIEIEKSESKTFTVCGTAVNDLTGEPLGGIPLHIYGVYWKAPYVDTYTNVDGRFEYNLDLEPLYGQCWFELTVSQVGYGWFTSRRIWPEDGEEYSFDIRLAPSLTLLSGTVVDAETGDPVPEVRVRVNSNDYKSTTIKRYAVTDEDGRFCIETVSDMHYILCEYRGYMRYEEEIYLPEGEETEFNIKIEPLTGRVKVAVVNARTGLAVPAVTVKLYNFSDDYGIGGTAGFQAVTGADGTADVYVEPGLYVAGTYHPDFAASESNKINIQKAKTAELVMRIVPFEAFVTGSVVDTAIGERVADFSICVAPPGAPVQLSFNPWTDIYPIDYSGDGSFTARVPAGEITIQCFYCGGYLDFSRTIFVRPGETAYIAIELEKIPPRTAKIEGVAVLKADGSPVPEAVLEVYFKGSWIDAAETDDIGGFSFEVPAGEIEIRVTPRLDEEPIFLYEGYHKVTVAEGETKEIKLELTITEDEY